VAVIGYTVIALDSTRRSAFTEGQQLGRAEVAKKVIFAYPGTEREVALSHILSKDQALAARAALR
jgi:hypothetical protein